MADLPDDDLVHACVLTYLSDISSGLAAMQEGTECSGASLDHAVWFHRRARLDEWAGVLSLYDPLTEAQYDVPVAAGARA